MINERKAKLGRSTREIALEIYERKANNEPISDDENAFLESEIAHQKELALAGTDAAPQNKMSFTPEYKRVGNQLIIINAE